jgi:uncharacterized protein GlcG (DUF336 family)
MAINPVEQLEDRRHLSASAALQPSLSVPVNAAAVSVNAAATPTAGALSAADVETILAQAGSQARPGQAVAVVDREGTVLGLFVRSGGDPAEQETIVSLAIQRARTAAAFQSDQNAFTTRTARFIIQNHFPFPVRKTPGGPLYGVEFSSFPGSDVLLPEYRTGISGDPGGVPLYLQKIPVGGIGVAGDGRDRAPTAELRDTLIGLEGSYGARAITRTFDGREERDVDEAVAIAGSRGYATPQSIRSTHIFLDGLRLPFTTSSRAKGKPQLALADLITGGTGTLVAAPGAGKADATVIGGTPRLTNGEVAGIAGLFRNRQATGATAPQEATRTPINALIDSNDAAATRLTADDVLTIMTNAVQQAIVTRAGIRKPNGATAQVHIVVVDRDGDVLGAFRMADGTNFSYDVAVQKARTATFFSDDSHAISTRAVGFASQKFFPPGIETGIPGPLFQLQDNITFNLANLQDGPLKNGITVFPGGVPLYKDGQLVGGVGVSGDGVDQDDLIAFAGETGFRPDDNIRSDHADSDSLANRLITQATALANDAGMPIGAGGGSFDPETARRRLTSGLNEVRLPYVKFPRNPLERRH